MIDYTLTKGSDLHFPIYVLSIVRMQMGDVLCKYGEAFTRPFQHALRMHKIPQYF